MQEMQTDWHSVYTCRIFRFCTRHLVSSLFDNVSSKERM